MEQRKSTSKKAPRWLKIWGVIAFYGLFLGAAETPEGGICLGWTLSWVANFGLFGIVANRYDWDDGKEPTKETEDVK